MLDRLDRTDIINAVALAAVLLLFGFAILEFLDMFRGAIDEGVVDSTKIEVEEVEQVTLAIPTEEVVVIVGNRSVGRQGLAGRATSKLDAIGYGTLPATNVNADLPAIDESFVYYADPADRNHALQIAAVLNIEETQVVTMIDDPGVSTEGVSIAVILGQLVQF